MLSLNQIADIRLLKQTVKCDIFPFLGTRDAEHLLAMMSLNPGNTLCGGVITLSSVDERAVAQRGWMSCLGSHS